MHRTLQAMAQARVMAGVGDLCRVSRAGSSVQSLETGCITNSPVTRHTGVIPGRIPIRAWVVETADRRFRTLASAEELTSGVVTLAAAGTLVVAISVAAAISDVVKPPEEHHGGIKAKSADAECFSEPREVPVLRPKWASSSPSQGPAALEIDVITGPEA